MTKKKKTLLEKAMETQEKESSKETIYINKIIEETGLSESEINKLVKEKKHELKGLISTEGALFIISKELDLNIIKTKINIENAFGTEPTMKEKKNTIPEDLGIINPNLVEVFRKSNSVEKPQPKNNQKEPLEYPLDLTITPKREIKRSHKELTLEERKTRVTEDIELIEFMVVSVLKPSDYQSYQTSEGLKKSVKRSGCQKLALAFNISTETLSIELREGVDDIGRPDLIAFAKVKAIRPNGTYVVATGKKAKSEYWSKKFQNYGSYNEHNISATAETRAFNRAVLNAIGFGEPKDFMAVSAEELSGSGNIEDAFGSK